MSFKNYYADLYVHAKVTFKHNNYAKWHAKVGFGFLRHPVYTEHKQ